MVRPPSPQSSAATSPEGAAGIDGKNSCRHVAGPGRQAISEPEVSHAVCSLTLRPSIGTLGTMQPVRLLLPWPGVGGDIKRFIALGGQQQDKRPRFAPATSTAAGPRAMDCIPS